MARLTITNTMSFASIKSTIEGAATGDLIMWEPGTYVFEETITPAPGRSLTMRVADNSGAGGG